MTYGAKARGLVSARGAVPLQTARNMPAIERMRVHGVGESKVGALGSPCRVDGECVRGGLYSSLQFALHEQSSGPAIQTCRERVAGVGAGRGPSSNPYIGGQLPSRRSNPLGLWRHSMMVKFESGPPTHF